MGTISKVSVNGVLYDLAGSGGGSSEASIYFIKNLNSLETFSTTTVKEALGSTDGINALYEAAKAGKIIVMKDDALGGFFVVNAQFESEATLILSWLYWKSSGRPIFRKVNIVNLLSPNVAGVASEEMAYYSDVTA